MWVNGNSSQLNLLEAKRAMDGILRCLLFAAAAVMISCSAYAQSECDKVLIETKISSYSNDYARLSYYYLWDRTRFDQARTDASGEGAAILDGLPIKAMVSFSDFRKHLEHEMRQINLQTETSAIRSYVTSYLPETVTTTWLDCMRSRRLSLWVKQLTDAGAVLKLMYIAGPDPRTLAVRIDRVNLSRDGLGALQGMWNSDHDLELTVRHLRAGKQAQLAVGVGATSRVAIIPVARTAAVPKPAVPPPWRIVGLQARLGTRDDDKDKGDGINETYYDSATIVGSNQNWGKALTFRNDDPNNLGQRFAVNVPYSDCGSMKYHILMGNDDGWHARISVTADVTNGAQSKTIEVVPAKDFDFANGSPRETDFPFTCPATP
jgi:hypothetical protein